MKSTLRTLAVLLCSLSTNAQELPLACAPSKPVAEMGESVQVEAWAPAGDWTFTWRAGTGQVDPHGMNAVWDLTDAKVGLQTITVEAVRPTRPRLTCVARVYVEKRIGSRGNLISRRFLLEPGTDPRTTYGLYSYVLLTPDGGDELAKQRNRSVLESWFEKILPLAGLERNASTAKLNATFVPINTDLAHAHLSAEPDLDWIVKHFDYQRADQLLVALVGAHTHGPYLVSAVAPLQSTYRGRLLVLDASWAPPSTARFWMDQFVSQAAQERFDQPRTFDIFNLKLRTAIGVLALGLPEAQKALASIITIGK